MKHLLLFVFAVCVTLSYAADSLNVLDASGMRQGRWVITNDIKKLPDYPATAKVEEGRYKDGKKVGKWKEYYPTGGIKNVITFENNRPNGYAIMYHPNGKIMEEGLWQNNRWVGDYKLYYDNGEVQQEFKFNANGKREGPQKYYYPNGQLMIEGNWVNGGEAGVVKEYHENGDLKSEKTFNNGQIDQASVKVYEPKKPIAAADKKTDLPPPPPADEPKSTKVDMVIEKPNLGTFNGEGCHKLYNKNKQLSKDGCFSKGKLMDGKIYHYDENGILKRIALYKQGIYVGDTVIEDEK